MHKTMSKQNKKDRAENSRGREPMTEAANARKEPEDAPKPEMKVNGSENTKNARRKDR